MNSRHLEALVWASRLGGIGAAARRLNLAQPTVTRRIQELESELQARLFERNGRNAALTAAGRRCLAHAERVLAEIDGMRVAVSDRSAMTGTIRVGVVELVALTWFDGLLKRVATIYPNMRVQIDVDLSSRLLTRLERRELDLIMVPGPISIAGAERVSLGSCAFRWMAAPALLSQQDPSIEELASLPILSMPREADAYRTMMSWFRAAGVEPQRTSYCSSFSVVASLVRKGVGISLMPVGLFSDEIASGHLVLIVEQPRVPNPEYSAAYIQSPEAAFLSDIARLAQNESWHPG